MGLFKIGFLSILVAMPRFVLSQSFVADTLNSREIRIDPTQANGAELSDLASEVEYIPLETTAKSYFGKVDRLVIMNDTFIIYDEETDAILIFDKNGKFINKISNVPHTKILKGSRRLTSFSIDRINKRIMVLLVTADYKQKLAFFDVLGNYISVEDVKADDPIARFDKFYALGNNHYIYANTLYMVPKDLKTLEADKKYELLWGKFPNTVYSRFLPFNFGQEITGSDSRGANFFKDEDTSVFYIKNFQYNVYKATPHGVKREYRFVFPYAMTMPAEFFTDRQLDGKRDAYLGRNSQYISEIGAFYKAGDCLAFDLKSQESMNIVGSVFLYSLKTGMLYSLQNVLPDSLNYHLPLFSELNATVQAADKNSIYTSMSSAGFLEIKKNQNEDKIKQYPPALKTFFSKASVKENPVIIKISIKSEI